MSKKKSRVGLGAALGLGAAVLAIGGIASAKSTGSGGRRTPTGGGGTGGGGGGGSPKPTGGGGSGGGGSSDDTGGSGGGSGGPSTTDGPGGLGTVYGDPSMVPDAFDFGGNHLWVSPDCDVVAEARYFRPDDGDFSVSAIEPPEYPAYVVGNEVEAVLLIDRENTIAGYIDWAMDNGLPPLPSTVQGWIEAWADETNGVPPIPAAMAIAAEVLRQISPLCMETPDPKEHWGPGLSAFMVDFMKWIEAYLIEWELIDFRPGTTQPEPAVG